MAQEKGVSGAPSGLPPRGAVLAALRTRLPRWREELVTWLGAPDALRSSAQRGAVLAAALAVGFLLTSGLTASREVAKVQTERKTQLIQLIEARQARTAAVAGQIEQLRAQVAAAEARASDGTALAAQVRRAEVAAGLTGVRGPGVRVTLADADGRCTQQEENCRIQDLDLQRAVNTLFGLGAEAVAVNGERIIATTAIRGAGRAILVNYGVLAPPYTVEAIGDAARLEEGLAASDLSADFVSWRDLFGLGYRVERVEELLLPAYSGTVRLRSAAPAEGAA